METRRDLWTSLCNVKVVKNEGDTVSWTRSCGGDNKKGVNILMRRPLPTRLHRQEDHHVTRKYLGQYSCEDLNWVQEVRGEFEWWAVVLHSFSTTVSCHRFG